MGIITRTVLITWFIATTAGLMPHDEIDILNAEQRQASYRLPESVKPKSYNLEIRADVIDKQSFEGKVRIEVEVLQEVSEIILHSYRLNIAKIELSQQSTPIPDIRYTLADNDTHFLTIHTPSPLNQGLIYYIDIEFNAALAEDMYGFYKSSYYTESNEIRWLAATKLQTAYARRIMPCFDEPSFKATFKINIIAPPGYHTISNMPLESSPEEAGDGWKIYRFMETKPMSTYLMAFVVSDFENLIVEEDKYKFSAWTRPEAVGNAQYSQDIGPSLVKFFEEYTEIPYAFPKIDQVALPDYVSGATENWGLIAYRETGLLYYDEASTESNKKSTAMVVAHELAHMWFGNLVTCKWWSDTWLNEAFANYFQYMSTNEVHSDWRLLDQFVIDQQQGIFGTDSLSSTPALSSECNTPAECQARFTSITYNKGASILRMLSHILTPATFQKALKNYLNQHAYNSTVPADLFDALEQQRILDNEPTPHSVYNILRAWTTQPGYPVINIQRNGNTFTLSQERFLLKADDEAPQLRWWVPLSWTKESDAPNGFNQASPVDWLTPALRDNDIQIDAEPSEWVIFNNQEAGYYRVNYDAQSWKLIIDGLHNDPLKIHVLNRAQLVDDALNLARAGKLDYAIALDVVDYIQHENDYIPWASASNALSFLNRKIISEADYVYFKTYIQNLIADKYDNLGFDVTASDSHLTHLHRASVLNWACSFDTADCITQSQNKFNDYMEDSTKLVHANLRSVVYCTALRHGGQEEWDFLWEVFKQSKIATEQVLILSSLGCTENEELLKRYLEMSIDPTIEIRKQNTASVYSAVYSNSKGVDVALDFLINKYREISENYGTQNSLSSILTGIAGRLTTEEQVNKLETFITENADNLGSATSAGRSAIQSARADMDWTNTHKEAILTWFRNKLDPSATSTSTDPPTTSTTEATTSALPTTTGSTTTDSASTLDHKEIMIVAIILFICTFIKQVVTII